MKTAFILTLFHFICLAHAQSLDERLRHFYQEVNEDWTKFELSMELSSDFESVLTELAQTQGLEEFHVKTIIDERDLNDFVDELFATPYVIPHFCYNFKGFLSDQLWDMRDVEIAALCRQKTEALIAPLLGGDLALRSFKISGQDRKGNFHKARLMAEDMKRGKSLIINFDVVLD